MSSTAGVFTVLGATGNIGSRVTSLLLSSGHRVRAVVRSKTSKPAQELEKQGAELWLVESKEEEGKTLTTDAIALSDALSGATAAFIMIPPNLHAENPENDAKQYVSTLRSAVEASKIERLVLLSAIGAHLEPAIGGCQPLRELELAFKPLKGVHKTFVRVSYFYLNVAPNLPPVRDLGFFPYTFSPESPIPLVSQDDIADQVALELQSLATTYATPSSASSDTSSGNTASSNKIVELTGPEDLTFEYISTTILADLTQKPIVYLHIPFDKQEKVWQSQGCSAQGALDFVDMYSAFSDGRASWENPSTLVRGKRLFKDYLKQALEQEEGQ